jgi:hypothetical protein
MEPDAEYKSFQEPSVENHVLIFRKAIMQTVLALISVHKDQYMALYWRAESQGEF